VSALTAAAAAVFWIPVCLTLQDYTQFLLFARVARDVGDPTSPFHGTYVLAPWFTPTSLPTQLTAALSFVLPGGIETAGKLLLSLHVVGLVGASHLLLRELERPRWCIALLFPLLYDVWTYGGFFAFATSMPWIVFAIALAIRFFRKRTLGRGLALAACLVTVFLWHGIGFAACGLAIAIFWLVARFPRWRDRLLATVPMLPSLALLYWWKKSTLDAATAAAERPVYVGFWDAVDAFTGYLLPAFEHSASRVWVFFALLLASQLLPSQLAPNRPARSVIRTFRMHNPMVLVGVAYLCAYFELPMFMSHVEGLANRFAYLSVLCLVFVWRLPRAASARAVTLGVTLALGFWMTRDMAGRLRDLDTRTRGASHLIDRLEPHDTLYYSAPARGSTPELPHALIELELIASVRKGGLPNTSFAGYRYTYARFVNDKNPMPAMGGPARPSAATRSFDYILTSDDGPLPYRRGFVPVASDGRWSLWGVCGTRHFPICD
jgi:hypothetical protein